MKIAVTGAAGQIGSRLCEDLARDHEIVRIDIQGVGEPIDVLDLDGLTRALAGSDTVVHLAGKVAVKASWDDTHENLIGTYNAFEAARRAKCNRVIFAITDIRKTESPQHHRIEGTRSTEAIDTESVVPPVFPRPFTMVD